MRKYIISSTVTTAFFIALLAIPAYSQAPAEPQPPVQEVAKAEEVSIYGEVQAINASTNSITVQYYDYDNDEEKTLEVTIDKDAKLENVKSIDEIKKGDWVDVSYTSGGGKNTAKMVNVEKEEPAVEEAAPAGGE